MAARKTARISVGQRKRRPAQLTLGSAAHAVLDALPARTASQYVEGLILKDAARKRRKLQATGGKLADHRPVVKAKG